jgi:hypothetical protein
MDFVLPARYHGEMGLHNKCKHCLGDGGVCRRVKLTNSVILSFWAVIFWAVVLV